MKLYIIIVFPTHSHRPQASLVWLCRPCSPSLACLSVLTAFVCPISQPLSVRPHNLCLSVLTAFVCLSPQPVSVRSHGLCLFVLTAFVCLSLHALSLRTADVVIIGLLLSTDRTIRDNWRCHYWHIVVCIDRTIRDCWRHYWHIVVYEQNYKRLLTSLLSYCCLQSERSETTDAVIIGIFMILSVDWAIRYYGRCHS